MYQRPYKKKQSLKRPVTGQFRAFCEILWVGLSSLRKHKKGCDCYAHSPIRLLFCIYFYSVLRLRSQVTNPAPMPPSITAYFCKCPNRDPDALFHPPLLFPLVRSPGGIDSSYTDSQPPAAWRLTSHWAP